MAPGLVLGLPPRGAQRRWRPRRHLWAVLVDTLRFASLAKSWPRISARWSSDSRRRWRPCRAVVSW